VAERFGAKIELGEVSTPSTHPKPIPRGRITAKAVLVATGSDYRKIGVPGEMEYYTAAYTTVPPATALL